MIATVAARLLPRPVRPAVVVEVHGDWRTASRSYGSRFRAIFSGVADRLAVGAILRADRVRVIGAYTESLVRATGYRGPVDAFATFRDFTPFLEPPLANTDDGLVAFLGGSAPVKGLDVLLRAWPTVASSVPGARLEVAGPGVTPDVEDDLGVVRRGPLDVEAVRDLLDRASIVVMPSRSEGMGRLALEAHGRAVPWWRAPSAGSPRSSRTVRPGCSCRPTIRLAGRRDRRAAPGPRAARAMGRLGRERMQARSPSDEFERGIERLASVGVAMTHVLFVTQVIDADDPTLGFVTSWIDALAERADGVTAIGNEVRGTPALAANVRVVSLGKERGAGRAARGFALQRAVATSGGHRPVLLAHMCPIYLDITAPVTACAPDANDAVVRAPIGDTGASARGATQRRRAHLPAGRLPSAGPEGSRGGPGHGHGAHRVRPAGRARSRSAPAGGDRPDLAVQRIRPSDPGAGQGARRRRRRDLADRGAVDH